MLIFAISSSTLNLRYLYYEALFTGCSFTPRMFTIYCCCDANASLSCRISFSASSLSPTEPVVWYFMLADSLVKKNLKLLQCLDLVGLHFQVSPGRLNNLVSLMERYAEQMIFFSVNAYSPSSANIFSLKCE